MERNWLFYCWRAANDCKLGDGYWAKDILLESVHLKDRENMEQKLLTAAEGKLFRYFLFFNHKVYIVTLDYQDEFGLILFLFILGLQEDFVCESWIDKWNLLLLVEIPEQYIFCMWTNQSICAQTIIFAQINQFLLTILHENQLIFAQCTLHISTVFFSPILQNSIFSPLRWIAFILPGHNTWHFSKDTDQIHLGGIHQQGST